MIKKILLSFLLMTLSIGYVVPALRPLFEEDDALMQQQKAQKNAQKKAAKKLKKSRKIVKEEEKKEHKKELNHKQKKQKKIKSQRKKQAEDRQYEELIMIKHRNHEQRQVCKEECLEKAEAAFIKRRQKNEERAVRLEGTRNLNQNLLKRWTALRKDEVREEYAIGAYADLFKSPTRQTYATYVSRNNFVNVTGFFTYATDGYDSDGANGDITRLVFGENSIRVQDILLVSKLAKQGVVTPNEPHMAYVTAPVGQPQYLKILADDEICFLGQAESWGMSFDLARYLWKRHIVAGVQCPFVYKKHRLRFGLVDNPIKRDFSNDSLLTDGLNEISADRGCAFMQRYGQDTNKFLRDIFFDKGFTDIGGSSSGLGDVTFFVHGNIDTNYVDNLMIGLRFIAPTAQKQSAEKLWAPELGNGGFFEGALWGSIVMNKHSYFNPHLFVQVNVSSSAHVSRRVPHKISVINNLNDAHKINDLGVSIPFGERVTLAKGARFSEFDGKVANFADTVACFKLTKGAEFNLRVGNIFEKLMLRRSFIDLYYDFRAKLRDEACGLNEDEWNIALFEKCSVQVEHKGGFEWSYQFDQGARWRAGVEYTFAGQNVEKLFKFSSSFNYSF